MTLNNPNWTSGDKVLSTKLNLMSSDQVNFIDDPHPQYGNLVASCTGDSFQNSPFLPIWHQLDYDGNPAKYRFIASGSFGQSTLDLYLYNSSGTLVRQLFDNYTSSSPGGSLNLADFQMEEASGLYGVKLDFLNNNTGISQFTLFRYFSE